MIKKLFLLAACLLAVFPLTACGQAAGGVTLNVLNWGDYIAPDLIEEFEEETGIHVNYTTMATNEDMFVQLQQKGNIYDVCFPSDYIIEKMIQDDMLAPIDQGNIPNLKNIDPKFLDISFDPGNQYSIPYMWGTVGILYNTTVVPSVDSWGVLWNPAYADQILMYDSIRDTIGVTLKYLGYPINTRETAHIDQVRDKLIEQKPLVLAYGGDDIKDKLATGSGALGVVYSGDACYSIGENPDLAYAVPKEGSNVWFDNIVIMKTTKNKAAAEQFIDFLCRADIAARNTEYIGYSTPNAEALKLLPEEMVGDPVYNPPQEDLDRCEVFHDLGDFIKVYNDAWLAVKVATE